MSKFSINNSIIIEALNRLQMEQAIVVVRAQGFKADLFLYEVGANGKGWNLVERMPANIGANGMGKAREGDQKSPSGVFSLGNAFGILPPPEGIHYPYVLLTPEDYWVDDSHSKDYNQWIHYREGDPKDWQSAERLWQETICYRYAVVVNYNLAREPGKGSAIFLHVWQGEDKPTQGCTAVTEANMIRILQWLDPDRAPVIIQGNPEDIRTIAQGHL